MINPFRRLLDEKALIVFDGAMGTVLFEHGIFINRCFDELNLTGAELVEQIHKAYLEAGAMVIETNTFGANRYKLAAFNLAHQVHEINVRGAQIGRAAASPHGIVAGSVGPLGLRVEPWGPTALEEAQEAFAEQIDALVEGGVDLIVCETFSDVTELEQAIRAAQQVAAKRGLDLPVIGSMTVDVNGQSLYGAEPEVFGPQIEEAGADVVGLNCSVGPRPMLEALERLREVTSKPLCVMPNAGRPTAVDGRTIYVTTPDYMANYARRFVQAGAFLVGGCCGTTPEHIRKIAESVRQQSGEARSLKVARKSSPPPRPEVSADVVPLPQRSALAAKIEARRFVCSVEIAPPHGYDLAKVLRAAAAAKQAGFDAVNIPDGPRAMARMGPLPMAVAIEREVGIETIMHYACRDRNLLGMQSDLLGAYALGLRNLLIITGDPPILGDYPQATAVFDVDAIGLTNMITRLNNGTDLGGKNIGKPTGYFVLVGLNPTAINEKRELERLQYKVDAGAHAIITQPIFDAEQLMRFLDKIPKGVERPVIAGVWPLQSLRSAEFLANEVPGVSMPSVLLERMAAARDSGQELEEGRRIAQEIVARILPRVDGLQIAAPMGRMSLATSVLDSARALLRERPTA
ncbi:MAG: bifunctional homocysteine S-methyltransferase/methylenetetrahydrofolate reductase [Myxococcota bacterium]|jgi:homocysteine S-methyltransferase|nr:bifunctional homocysteine S-methyltransferase/methylenetetrahydrofolate reductase [Myxococcota bacterium]